MNALLDKIMEAGRQGGWALALIVATVAIVLTAIAQFNPAEEAGTAIGNPVASTLGLTSSRCPSGWSDTSGEDEHTLVRSCKRDKWVVVLEEDGSFDHAIQLDTPGSEVVEDPQAVPGWE